MTSRLSQQVRFFFWLILAIPLVSVWIVDAVQQATTPRRTSTGTSSSRDASQLRVNRVHRDAGGRSFWHSHPQGQVFYIEEGRGLLQERGGRIVQLKKGDEPVFTPPDVEHWHGAAPDEGGTYVAIACCADDYVKWLDEEVTDAIYNGKSIPRQQATAADLRAKGNK
jgi:quercetin dioxygenase-like cupin family protein